MCAVMVSDLNIKTAMTNKCKSKEELANVFRSNIKDVISACLMLMDCEKNGVCYTRIQPENMKKVLSPFYNLAKFHGKTKSQVFLPLGDNGLLLSKEQIDFNKVEKDTIIHFDSNLILEASQWENLREVSDVAIKTYKDKEHHTFSNNVEIDVLWSSPLNNAFYSNVKLLVKEIEAENIKDYILKEKIDYCNKDFSFNGSGFNLFKEFLVIKPSCYVFASISEAKIMEYSLKRKRN